MNLVIYIDGSRAAEDAVRYAARWCPPETRVVLLHVVPSGREAALHNAEKVLARSSALFRSLAGTQREVTTRLEVGNAVTRITEVADALDADAIIMGSHDVGALPRSQVLGQAAEDTVAATNRPVVLVFPEGSEVVPAASIH
ncbi:MAG: universal stress protein [Armatimonadetes bacterium]|jgi:nucleotide-binding universal stress UspA family protein|nr:universal stress protein [Armatimonadota bacterium]